MLESMLVVLALEKPPGSVLCVVCQPLTEVVVFRRLWWCDEAPPTGLGRVQSSHAGCRRHKVTNCSHYTWAGVPHIAAISAAISVNGEVALFWIDQLQGVSHSLSAPFNQLWAITVG